MAISAAVDSVRAVVATAAELTEQCMRLHDAPADEQSAQVVQAVASRYEEQNATLRATLLAIEEGQAGGAKVGASPLALQERDELRAQVRERNGVVKQLIEKMRRLQAVLGTLGAPVDTTARAAAGPVNAAR